MAKNVEVREWISDDLDPSVTEGVMTVRLTWGGKALMIDLGPKNADKLAKALEPFVKVARADDGKGLVTKAKGTTAKGSSKVARPEYDKAELKRWAEGQGRWNGKRPKDALIEEFLRTFSPASQTTGYEETDKAK